MIRIVSNLEIKFYEERRLRTDFIFQAASPALLSHANQMTLGDI